MCDKPLVYRIRVWNVQEWITWSWTTNLNCLNSYTIAFQRRQRRQKIRVLSSLAEFSRSQRSSARCQLNADGSLAKNETRLYFNLKQWSRTSTSSTPTAFYLAQHFVSPRRVVVSRLYSGWLTGLIYSPVIILTLSSYLMGRIFQWNIALYITRHYHSFPNEYTNGNIRVVSLYTLIRKSQMTDHSWYVRIYREPVL